MFVQLQRRKRRELSGKVGVAELEDLLRGGEAFEPMLPQIAERDITRQRCTHQCGGDFRNENLPAMPDAHYTRGAVDLRAVVITFPLLAFAGVQPHPHFERAGRAEPGLTRKRLLSRQRRGNPVRGRFEHRVEPIARSFDHSSAVTFNACAHQRIMAGSVLLHLVGKLLPKQRAVFKVGEEERERGCHGSILSYRCDGLAASGDKRSA